MAGTNEGGTASSQDRANQPKRAGGNCADYGIEKHDQKKATKIGIQAEGGAGRDTGKASTWGAQRDCGGNEATEASAIEQHGRLQSAEYVEHDNSPADAKKMKIPAHIEKGKRDAGAGNDDGGLREKRGRGSLKVPASRRFDS